MNRGISGSGSASNRSLSVVGDLAPVALFGLLIIATYLQPTLGGDAGNPALRPIDGPWLAAGMAAAASLVFRRRYPLASACVVMIAISLVAALSYDLDPIAWMVYVSAFALGRHTSLRRSMIAFAMFGLTTLATYVSALGMPAAGFAFAWAFFLLAWLAGKELRRWRERLEMEQVDADRRVAMERQSAQLAMAEERLHIAQELHDVVAHSMSVIAVQAGMAEAAFDRRPDEARRAIQNILGTSRGSLSEIRRLLGVLRDDAAGRASYSPAPTLADLPELVAAVERNGLDVTLTGHRGADAPPGVQLSAYRIVQEALTNVLEHSGATEVAVNVDSDGCCIEIEVVDNGTGPIPDAIDQARGFGIVGMHERVSTYGGTLDAGEGQDGGFRVRASIPISAEGGG